MRSHLSLFMEIFCPFDTVVDRCTDKDALAIGRDACLAKYVEHSPAAIAMFDREMKYLVVSLRWMEAGIIGFAEFLADGKPGGVSPKQKEYLEDILNSGKRLLQLIGDVLDLAKVGAGKMELNPERFSFRKAIGEACAVAKPIAQKKTSVSM